MQWLTCYSVNVRVPQRARCWRCYLLAGFHQKVRAVEKSCGFGPVCGSSAKPRTGRAPRICRIRFGWISSSFSSLSFSFRVHVASIGLYWIRDGNTQRIPSSRCWLRRTNEGATCSFSRLSLLSVTFRFEVFSRFDMVVIVASSTIRPLQRYRARSSEAVSLRIML